MFLLSQTSLKIYYINSKIKMINLNKKSRINQTFVSHFYNSIK